MEAEFAMRHDPARALAALCTLLLAAALLAGSALAADPMAPVLDRPPYASSPAVLDPGHLQLELGAQTQWARDGAPRMAGLLGRIQLGLAPQLEIEAGGFPWLWLDPEDDDTASGPGDGYFNLRVQLCGDDAGRCVSGLELATSLPLALQRPELGTGHFEPGLALLLELRPHPDITIDLNAGVGWAAESGPGRRYRAQEFAIASLTVSRGRLAPFVEFVWNATHGDPASDLVLLDAGLACSLRPGLQLDVSALVGLSDGAPAFGLTVGLVWGPRRVW